MKEQAYFSCSCSVLVLGPKIFFVLVLFVLCSRVLESQSKKRSWSHVMCSTTGIKVYGLFAIGPWSLRENILSAEVYGPWILKPKVLKSNVYGPTNDF